MHYIFFLIFKSLFPGNHFNGKKFGCSHPLTKATPFPPDSYTHCLGWLHPFCFLQASPFISNIGGVSSSCNRIGPNARSYLAIFSSSARCKRLACSGARITRDCTPALGNPGNTRTKSSTNSELEWVIMAKLAYVPCATSSFNSICYWLSGFWFSIV